MIMFKHDSRIYFKTLSCFIILLSLTSCGKPTGEVSTQKKNSPQCSVPISIINLESNLFDPITKKGWFFVGNESRNKEFGFPSAQFNEQLITDLSVPAMAKKVRFSILLSTDTVGASVILDMIWFLNKKEVSRSASSIVIDESRSGNIMGILAVPNEADRLTLIIRPWRDIDGLALPHEGQVIWCP